MRPIHSNLLSFVRSSCVENFQRDLKFAPRYNIGPSQKVPVIVKGDSGYDAQLNEVGLVPWWAKDISIGIA